MTVPKNVSILPTTNAKTISCLSVSEVRRIDEMRRGIDEPAFRKYQFRASELAPTTAERAVLAERAADLTRALHPASMSAISVEVNGVFLNMVCERVSEQEQFAKMRGYCADLVGVPAFALIEAAKRFRGRENKFVPTPGELKQEAERIAQPFHLELAKIRAILTAEVPDKPANTPAQRKAAIEHYVRELKPVLQACQPPNEIALGIPAPRAPSRRRTDMSDEERKVFELELEKTRERIASEGRIELSRAALGTLGEQQAAPERAA